jgi:hypothetical protein
MDDELEVTEIAPVEPSAKPSKGTIASEDVANPALKEYFNMDRTSDTTARKYNDILEYFGDQPEGCKSTTAAATVTSHDETGSHHHATLIGKNALCKGSFPFFCNCRR